MPASTVLHCCVCKSPVPQRSHLQVASWLSECEEYVRALASYWGQVAIRPSAVDPATGRSVVCYGCFTTALASWKLSVPPTAQTEASDIGRALYNCFRGDPQHLRALGVLGSYLRRSVPNNSLMEDFIHGWNLAAEEDADEGLWW